MSKRLWVTGYGGFLAGHVVRLADESWGVVAIARREVPPANPAAQYPLVDLLDDAAVQALAAELPPAAIIHCAAIADIDYCAKNKEAADAINVGAVERLAAIAARCGARMVHCSTDTVFDGQHGPYKESDVPAPVNYYGETKVRAEAIVSAMEDAVVVRIPLIMGLTVQDTGHAFLAKFIANAEEGRPTAFPENELRTPVDVITLALALLELAGNDYTGILHVSGNSRLNRFEMGQRIATHLGYGTMLVDATNSNAMPDRAPRPDDVSLDNSRASDVLKTPMRSIEEGLDLIMEHKRLMSS